MSVSSSTVVTTIYVAAAVASHVHRGGLLAGRSQGTHVLHSLALGVGSVGSSSIAMQHGGWGRPARSWCGAHRTGPASKGP